VADSSYFGSIYGGHIAELKPGLELKAMSPAQRNPRKLYVLAGAMLTIVGVVLFCKLGLWQWHRAAEKRALIELYAHGESTLVHADSVDALTRYQRVELQGRFDSSHQVLLDNMPSPTTGQPGYRVLTPFNTGREWLLVDRGWVPLGRTRVDLPPIGVNEHVRTLRGRVDDLPEPGIRLGEQAVDAKQPWPRVLNFPTYPLLQGMLPSPLAHPIVLLDPEAADGFERVWQISLRVSPERHIAYAVQWFAFAVAAVIIFFVLTLRRGDHSHVD
jgi:surfeit locus 1 family protein